MKNRFYVYKYIAKEEGAVKQFIKNKKNEVIGEEEIYLQKGDAFYIGKGQDKRCDKNIRNENCEIIKKELGYDCVIIKENLTEEEALNLECEIIDDYRIRKKYLTNILRGSSSQSEIEEYRIVKYLLNLKKEGVINITYTNITKETGVNHAMISAIQNNKGGKYGDIVAKCPDNIDYILKEYDAEILDETTLKYSNIKYVLNLMDGGIIKATQVDIAKYFNEEPTLVNSIYKDKQKGVKRAIKPDNLADILKCFNPYNLTEDEIRKGKLMSLYNMFVDNPNYSLTEADLIRETQHIYGISVNGLSDLKRRGTKTRLVHPEKSVVSNIVEKYLVLEEFYIAKE